jgi:sulfopyruvate decarboxylase TPP-binding subunit
VPDASSRPTSLDVPDGARQLYLGLKDGGVDFAVYLPDSTLPPVERLLNADPDVQTVVCAREDEGIAIAVGAWLGGRTAVALMEGSGIGYGGLILARAQLQRTPILVVASHTRALDEPYDFHAATRIVGEGVLVGLGIPYVIVTEARQLRTIAARALATVRGQRSCVGLLLPNYVIHGDG